MDKMVEDGMMKGMRMFDKMMKNGGRQIRKIPRKLKRNTSDGGVHDKGTILKFLSNPLLTPGLTPTNNGGGVKRENDDELNGMDKMDGTSKKFKMGIIQNYDTRGSKSFTRKKRDCRSKLQINQSMDLRSFFGSGDKDSQGISRK